MKKIYLLDTNIISEFSKERPNQNVIALYEARKNFCAISAITWQEHAKLILKNVLLNTKKNLR